MVRSTLSTILVCLFAGLASAQSGARILGAQQFVLDDGSFANPRIYLTEVNGSMGIDPFGLVSGAFPNTAALLTLSSTKATGLMITGSPTSLNTSGSVIIGDLAGTDGLTLNLFGGGQFVINNLPAPALPSPLSNLLYLSGSNQVVQTPGGVNVVTGSGTTNKLPLWTPNGFQLGNSYLTQSTNVAGGTLTSSERTIVNSTVNGVSTLTVNNADNTSTGLKINANGGTGINVDPAGIGIKVDATVTGIDVGTGASKPITGINISPNTTGVKVNGIAATSAGINVDMTTNPVTTLSSSIYQGQITGAAGVNVYGGNVNVFSNGGSATGFGTTTSVNGAGNTNGVFAAASSNGSGYVNGVAGGAFASGASTSNLNGGFFQSTGGAASLQVNGISANAISANATNAIGGVFGASGSTLTNIGIACNATGVTGINTGVSLNVSGANSVGIDMPTKVANGIQVLSSNIGISVNSDNYGVLATTTGILGGAGQFKINNATSLGTSLQAATNGLGSALDASSTNTTANIPVAIIAGRSVNGNVLVLNYVGAGVSTPTAANLAQFDKSGSVQARIDNLGNYITGGNANSFGSGGTDAIVTINGIADATTGNVNGDAVWDARVNGDLLVTGMQRIAGAATSINATGVIQTTSDVKLGPSAALFAAGGEENLRVLRGGVLSNGTINSGSGFTVTHVAGTGFYTINFNTAFSSTPTVVVSGASAPCFAMIIGIVNGSATIQTYNLAGVATDENFTMIVAGPR